MSAFQPPSSSSLVLREGWVATRVVSGVTFHPLELVSGAGVIIGAAATELPSEFL